MQRIGIEQVAKRRGPFVNGQRGWRAYIESILVQLLVVGVVVWIQRKDQIPFESMLYVYIMISVCPAIWLAARWRLRPRERARGRQVWIETGMASALGVLSLGGEWLSIQIMSGQAVVPHISIEKYVITACVTVCVIGGALWAARLGWYLLALWTHLRRSRLRWELTHAHLMVVIVGAGLIVLLLLGGSVVFSDPRSTYVEIAGLLAIVVFLTMLTIAFLLPVFIGFSYFLARRLTQRIERLALAAGALRHGNYSARVLVDGQDEIARLQTDFNSMAGELEQRMRELKAERDNVATLLQARRELIASVSHELRTPVATIRGYLESVSGGWQESEAPLTLKQDMRVMEQQVVRLQGLIQDLFTLARAEVGRLEMRPEPTDIATLVKRVADGIAPLAWRGSRVEVLAEIGEHESGIPSVFVDGQRVEQILQNLIHNAVRHTAPGGIIALRVSCEEGYVQVQVSDTGEGIAKEDLPRIWERFFRANNEQARPGTGSGLGLAIVKELTEAMQGTISVESRVGEGTCFTLRFPCYEVGGSGSQKPGEDESVEKLNEIDVAIQER